MSKNSPKKGSDRLPSDGSISPHEVSPAIREGGGGGGGGGAGTETVEKETTFSFTLDRVVLPQLSELRPGQAIEFSEESATTIATVRLGKTIGYVPATYLKRVKAVMEGGSYSAEVEDVSHERVWVRVTP
jgi:hypothetical protein